MALYTLICPRCATNTEIMAPWNEATDTIYDCDHCGAQLCRRDNRNFTADMPQIQGETVAGGCDYSGWDEGLQCHVNGKKHRSEIMKARGLTPFEMSDIQKQCFDKVDDILNNSPKGCPEAAKAIKAEALAAERKRRRKSIRETFKKKTRDLSVS